ncbi:NSFL1 cofactor p47 [Exaiptasia diaphana]|nr:NSFL1 cofactor p47 [Exaiptasia diaphana]
MSSLSIIDIVSKHFRHGAEEVHNDEPGPRRQTAPTFTGAGYRLGDTEGGPSQQVAGTSQPANEQHNLYFDNQLQNGIGGGKLRTYCKIKRNFKFENYLDNVSNVRHRIAGTKLRVSAHKLPVESGRYQKIAYDDRKCTLCGSNSVGDEFHYIMSCKEIPKELYRLSRGGEVHVNIEDHRQEEYTPPKKKKIIAFVGKGQKLGSPTPTVKFSDEKKGASSSSDVATVNFDQSKPSTSIQIRLADGTR